MGVLMKLLAIMIGVAFAGAILGSGNASAADCFQSSITKPQPFMGNNDEVFQLVDGSIWQVKYEYEYMYAYYPDVIICPSDGKLIIESKQLNVVQLSPARVLPKAKVPATPGNPAAPSTSAPRAAPQEVIQSRINGEFKGWEGETVYVLTNGQIWQQASYHYHYHYAYSPEVLIYPSYGVFKIHIDGDDDEDVEVRRLK